MDYDYVICASILTTRHCEAIHYCTRDLKTTAKGQRQDILNIGSFKATPTTVTGFIKFVPS